MYPLVRLRKLVPDGSVKISWYCYRLADREGFARLFVPQGTTRLHAKGSWTPDGISIAALDPRRGYVVHWWRSEARSGFYVDTARSIAVDSDAASFVDLFLDLSYDGDGWHTLDETELALASSADADLARRAADEVRTLIARGAPLFDPTSALWDVPADALALPPKQVMELR